MIGSGILTLPWATSQFGLLLSLAGLVYLAYLSQVAIRLMVRCVAFTPTQRKTLVDEIRHTGSLRASRRSTHTHDLEAEDRTTPITPLPNDASGQPARATENTGVVADGHGCGSWQIIATAAYGTPARIVTLTMLSLAQCELAARFERSLSRLVFG